MDIRAPISFEIDTERLVEKITTNLLERIDTSNTKEILTEKEVLKYLDCSTNTLRSYEQRGLKFSKVGTKRFYEFENIRRFMKKFEM